MDTLTWWLQPEIKKALESKKTATQKWPAAKNYIDELRKHGASQEYIDKEMAEMAKEQGVNPEEFDDFKVIRGPNAK